MPYRFRAFFPAFFPMLRIPERDSEIMQSAGDFHDKVAESFFRVSEHIFDNAETLHARDDMLRNDTDPGNHLIENFILSRQFFSPGTSFPADDRRCFRVRTPETRCL